MSQTDWGPVPITQGRSASFTAEFLDANGIVTTPSGATLSISYTNLSNTSVTESIDMTLSGSFFTGTWSSTSAAYGLANWSVTASGNSTASQTGQIRIIYP